MAKKKKPTKPVKKPGKIKRPKKGGATTQDDSTNPDPKPPKT